MRRITDAFRTTPQSAPIPGAGQVQNRAGGFAWAVDEWTHLDRFLILGTSAPTYYASARELTLEAASAVVTCLANDGPRTIDRVVGISDAGRASTNDPALFALAMALKLGDPATRRLARDALPAVARTLAHVYRFAEAVDALGGWGRGTQRAFRQWLTGREVGSLAYQALKYRQREGWTLRDVLRKVHLRPPSAAHDALFAWACKGGEPGGGLDQLEAFVRLQSTTDVQQGCALILAHDLPREAVPTGLLGERAIWDALLQRMPTTALLRSLGKLSAVGLLVGNSSAERLVVERFGDARGLAKARIHPLALLSAHAVYGAGAGVKGSLAWRPVKSVVGALDQAFYLSFGHVPSTGLRQLLALDVSGSMDGGTIASLAGLTPRTASAAMAMVTLRREAGARTMGFAHELRPLDLRPGDRLEQVVSKVRAVPMGGTDCALPMLHAAKKGLEIDTFLVYTDNETWFGSTHPARALEQYREKTGIPARLVVVGLTADKFSIADPRDGGMLDVVGFDVAAPRLMADFATGA
jgi:60 kDa SS-A/Ro ribonucleoprotein